MSLRNFITRLALPESPAALTMVPPAVAEIAIEPKAPEIITLLDMAGQQRGKQSLAACGPRTLSRQWRGIS
jgi:hypothetical protein